jgi:hypothetical protein
MYRCERWTLILRKEHGPKVFEKRVLRRIFGPNRDEIVGGCRKVHYTGRSTAEETGLAP